MVSGNGNGDAAPLLIIPKEPVEVEEIQQTEVEVNEQVEEKVDPFAPVIHHYLRIESPSTRKAINETPCFIKLWRDTQLKKCPETGCALRPLCETGYNQATGFPVDSESEVPEEDLVLRRYKKELNGPLKPPKRKVTKQPRESYVSLNRRSDKFLEYVFQNVGAPPELPLNWYYGSMSTYQARCMSQEYFMHRYGSGLCCCSRKSHWRLFHNGLHVCRIWLDTKLSCWVDCNPWLVDALSDEGVRMEPPALKRGNRGTFPVYTGRTKMWTEHHAVVLSRAILATVGQMEAREE